MTSLFNCLNDTDLALDDLHQQYNWRQLEDQCWQVAHWLQHQGVGPGHHICLLLDNRSDSIVLMIGCWLAGTWLTPINRQWHGQEIDYVVIDSECQLLLAEPHYLDKLQSQAHACVVAVEQQWLSYPTTALSLDRPAAGWMLYTSGTTGQPKGVKRHQPATLAESLQQMRNNGHHFGLDGQGPHLLTGPMYHAAPLLFALYDLFNGAALIIMAKWDSHQALQLLQQRQVRHTHLVPTHCVRLLQLPEVKRQTFKAPHLTRVLHGAAPMPEATKQQMIDWWGPILSEYWGGTEAGVTTLASSAEWLQHPGSVGRPLPHYRVFAADDQGQALPNGQSGELYCQHQSLIQVFSYHNAPDKTARAHPQPGTFTLGDLGYVDDDGYVYLSDRRSHTIISGGVNIYPAEIEAVLLQHPLVADVAVFGVADAEWGESVHAILSPRAQISRGQLQEAIDSDNIANFCRQQMARYKVPKVFSCQTELTRHENGKLLLRQIKAEYLSKQAVC